MVGIVLDAADIAVLMHWDGSKVEIWLISLRHFWSIFNFWLEIALFLVRFFRLILFYYNGSLFIGFLRFLLFKAILLPLWIFSFFFDRWDLMGLSALFVNGTWLQLKSESLGILAFLINTKVSSVDSSMSLWWSWWWVFVVPLSSLLWTWLTWLWVPIPMFSCTIWRLFYFEDLLIGLFDYLLLFDCFFEVFECSLIKWRKGGVGKIGADEILVSWRYSSCENGSVEG